MRKSGILIVAMVLVASNAWAFRGGCGMGPGLGMGPGFGMNPHVASTLDLTEDQKAEIQAKQEAFQEEINPLKEKLFKKRMEMREQWAKADPSLAKITEKQQEIQSLQSQIQEKAARYRLECRQVLTPEQKEKLGANYAQCGRWGGPGCKMCRW